MSICFLENKTHFYPATVHNKLANAVLFFTIVFRVGIAHHDCSTVYKVSFHTLIWLRILCSPLNPIAVVAELLPWRIW